LINHIPKHINSETATGQEKIVTSIYSDYHQKVKILQDFTLWKSKSIDWIDWFWFNSFQGSTIFSQHQSRAYCTLNRYGYLFPEWLTFSLWYTPVIEMRQMPMFSLPAVHRYGFSRRPSCLT